MLSGPSSGGLKFMGLLGKKKKEDAKPAPRKIDTPAGFDASTPIKPKKPVTEDQFKASGMSPEDQSKDIRAKDLNEQANQLIAKRTISFHHTATGANGSSEALADPKAPETFMAKSLPEIPWKDNDPSVES